jgi:hypothetical protein
LAIQVAGDNAAEASEYLGFGTGTPLLSTRIGPSVTSLIFSKETCTENGPNTYRGELHCARIGARKVSKFVATHRAPVYRARIGEQGPEMRRYYQKNKRFK